MLIDAELLLNYQRCSRRAFLDAYGDALQRDPPNDYLLKILQDSRDNQRSILTHQTYKKPEYPLGDWRSGAESTLALMRQGVDRISQAVLLAEISDGVTLLSKPDLLEKQPGQSLFGDWIYAPTEIKLGKRPKLEYQIVAAFHAQVLAQVQGAWAEETWLLLRDRGAYAVDLWEMQPRMQEILTECIAVMTQAQEPEVFISRSRCSLCHWFSHCYAIAKSEHHLSLLPGVTAARYLQLEALKLTTVKSLAETNPADLEPLPGFGRETAHKIVRQARSTLQNRAFLIAAPEELPLSFTAASKSPTSKSPTSKSSSLVSTSYSSSSYTGLPSRQPLAFLAANSPPTAPVELYFDIEAEPGLNLVYLHGVLVVDRLTHTETFHPLLAESPQDEIQVWHQFLDLVWTYPTAPIFHFCPFELQTVERLAKLYATPTQRVQPLLPRFFDLHEQVTQTVTLPVESYALKPIARWLGFDWRDPNANGALAIYWYAQWLATGDRAYLNTIVQYNEDDCRATYHIKEWLVSFLQNFYQAELA